MCKLFKKLKKVIRNTNAESKMELAPITEELTETEKKEFNSFKKDLQEMNKLFEKHCCNIL